MCTLRNRPLTMVQFTALIKILLRLCIFICILMCKCRFFKKIKSCYLPQNDMELTI